MGARRLLSLNLPKLKRAAELFRLLKTLKIDLADQPDRRLPARCPLAWLRLSFMAMSRYSCQLRVSRPFRAIAAINLPCCGAEIGRKVTPYCIIRWQCVLFVVAGLQAGFLPYLVRPALATNRLVCLDYGGERPIVYRVIGAGFRAGVERRGFALLLQTPI